jgi:drug/metabolite transporter (DMT)-like permease
MKQNPFPPVIVLILGILAVSTASLLIRLAQREAPSFVIAAGRLTIAALILFPFAMRNLRSDIRTITHKNSLLLGLAGLFLGLHFATWITSLEYTSVASSVVIVTTAPLWVALFSPVFLNEKITQWVLIGLGVSLIGSVIVGLNSACTFSSGKVICQTILDMNSSTTVTGNLLALAGAFFSAGYLIIGRRIRNSLNLVSYTFVVYAFAALVLIILVFVTGQSILGYSKITYLLILGLAIIPQLLGHSSFNWALKYLSATLVSIALLGEPIGTVLLSFTLLKETPTVFEIVGGVLILLGILVASRRKPDKQEDVSPVG